jgi:hypothetical protein
MPISYLDTEAVIGTAIKTSTLLTHVIGVFIKVIIWAVTVMLT